MRVLLAVLLAAACGGPQNSDTADLAAPPAQETVVTVAVLSGLPQPPPKETAVTLPSPVVVRLQGLGPPRAVILGPDGAAIPTRDAPLTENGSIVGTEHRFTPQKPGTYRVEQAEVQGVEIARIVAR